MVDTNTKLAKFMCTFLIIWLLEKRFGIKSDGLVPPTHATFQFIDMFLLLSVKYFSVCPRDHA